ncbi:sulfatase-like hydrolase/transferase [Aeoliella sp. ICT_H6.2]|uniref:Sulfatase-like hydrolase/transferase n=1 Tax=Aeoliella straminimaris TaxID=2954799 RepID=A0A9X2FGH2_9BACT|nr:sulfatase-like hydrolase/transferase [Aeoliella straminimaris]MCO6047707.1 sulfatase-like hydrolase/transferase [Aeoliella straminimaris]
MCFARLPVAEAAATDAPPNIVLIISDDQAWTDYGFMGHEAIETPNLDQLAQSGITFRRGYVPTALCRPSLATLVTGLYAHKHLITGNDPARTAANRAHAQRAGVDPRELLISNIDKHPTLPRLLAERGYLSFQCGKWWEGSYQRGGFTHGMTRGYPERGGRHGDDGLEIGRQGMQPVFDFIDTATDAGKPFFLWYAPFLPHSPHNPPERILAKYRQQGRPKSVAKYYAMCEWFDETCGQLLDRLDEKHLAENTLVIYVTDNGWIQDPQSSSYAARSKRSPYEGGIRTPIMFSWPGKLQPAERPELCSSIDIAPTILAAAGAEIPDNLPGENLLPYLQDEAVIDRDTIYGESFAHDIADIEDPRASLLHRWVIRGNDKLLLTYDGVPGKMKFPPGSDAPQLYDLEADPNEQTNLAAQEPEVVDELGNLLNEWYAVSESKVKEAGVEHDDDRPQRPNILLVFADDQRNHTLGYAGHPVVKTPNIDQLAADGVRFENTFVTTSTCWSSRACLFTGCYERKHLYQVRPGPLNPQLCQSSYFAVLKAAGYRTGHLGKEHVTIDKPSAEAMFDVRRRIGRNPYFKPQPDGTKRHETQILGDWGIEFIKSQPAEQPFCLTISFNASHAEDGDHRPGIGHYPWPKVTDGMYEDQEMPLPRLDDPAIYASQPQFLKDSINRQRYFWRWDASEKYQTNMRAYFRMISGIDHVVGRLVKQLEEQGLADNTVIIYTADNGYYLGDRGFAGKWTHYEESLRVPLVIYDPRLPTEAKGKVRQEMALNSDLASTMIDLAGETPPVAHSGRSLVPLVRGATVADWRTDFLCEFLAVPKTIPRWEGVRDTDWVYARYFVDGPGESPYEFLHSLEEDPDELVNIAMLPPDQQSAAQREALDAMRNRCDALIAEQGPAMDQLPGK